MSNYIEWITVVLLFVAVIFVAVGYYEIQARKYRAGGHNEEMDKFRGGGSCH